MKISLRYGLTFACALGLALAGGLPAGAQESGPQTEEHKIVYAIGIAMSQQFANLGLDAEEVGYLQAGLGDALLGREPKVDLQAYGPKIQGFAQQRMTAAAAAEKEAGKALLDAERSAEGAVTTDSGLVYFELQAGEGEGPGATDTVVAHYKGTLRDGTVFDSSYDRGEPSRFALNQVVPCWTEALQRMKPGGKSRFLCPSDLAYGDQGRPGIPPGATLVFEVELFEVVRE